MTPTAQIAGEHLQAIEHLHEDIESLGSEADLVIACQADYQRATAFLLDVKARAKDLDELRRSITRPMDEAKRRVMDLFRPIEATLSNLETRGKRAILTYEQAEERKRREEERRLREAAEAERLKLEKAAARAEKMGKAETAEILREQAETVATAPVVLAETKRPSGISMRETWSAEVTDLIALARGVAEGTVPPAAIQPNMPMLNQTARALRGALNWPGVRAVSSQNVAAGGYR